MAIKFRVAEKSPIKVNIGYTITVFLYKKLILISIHFELYRLQMYLN